MNPVDIKVYTRHPSPRLGWVAGVLLRDLLGLSYSVITDKRKIGTTPLINYSGEDIQGSFAITPCGLLEEDFIRSEDPETDCIDETVVLFPGSGHMHFDIFAAAFWLLSRCEEYRPFKADRHGRYPAEESLSFRKGFLHKPVVEIWARKLAGELIRLFPFMAFRRNEFRPLITFDIDQAYAYLGKGLLRGAAGMVTGLVKGGAKERWRTISGSSSDPYDVYDYITREIDARGSEAIFFFPFGSWSEFDRNNRYDSRVYRTLVAGMAERYLTGVHFSYSSGRNHGLIRKEAERFAHTAGFRPEASRHHYLVIKLPETYRGLEDEGIKTDYSLGYASVPGFRAGISRPFSFYDLGREQETRLTVAPFAFMDVTLKDYLRLDVAGARKVIENLVAEVKGTGGTFISIWHNSSLTGMGEWEGWREVFEHTLNLTSK
ncbi:MAG: polysaccharide deacetylase family protein [Bacteroidales bacterium]|jgi:hypothetical protein|nr:polysaccharide deacetylase family protein [Bacteroidales bacterium]